MPYKELKRTKNTNRLKEKTHTHKPDKIRDRLQKKLQQKSKKK